MVLLVFHYFVFIVYSDSNLKSQVFKPKLGYSHARSPKEKYHISVMEWRETQLIGFKGFFLAGFLIAFEQYFFCFLDRGGTKLFLILLSKWASYPSIFQI